jgi:hypothetical protein
MRSSDIVVLTQAADFLIKYGFLAVGLLLFAATAVILKFWKSRRVGLATGCAGIAFIVAFGAIDIVQKYFPWLISSQRAVLSGVVLGLSDGFQIQLRSDRRHIGQAYTKREFDPQVRSLYNFPFIFVTTEAPSCLALAIASTDQNTELSRTFNIGPISREDMEGHTELVAKIVPHEDTFKIQLWRERNFNRVGKSATFEPLRAAARDCGSEETAAAPLLRLIPSAFAQGLTFEDFAVKLRSDDVFTRRDARIELSRQGAAGFDTARKLLDQNNYRLQLGATVAIGELPADQRKQVPAEIISKLRELRSHPDKTMRDAAARAVGEPAFCYQEQDAAKSPGERYLALCLWSLEDCEKIRGPNTRSGISQTGCTAVDLSKASWTYAPGGIGGAWYQLRATPVAPPFPQIQ